MPIYHQLHQGIIELIEAGQLSPGASIPSENDLSRTYNISPMTVRQAMAELVNDGYIYRRRGRGTFVSSRPMQRQMEKLTGFSEDMRARGMDPGSQILIFEKILPPKVMVKRLGISPDEKVTRIKRLRLANNQPVGIHDAYLSGASISHLEIEQNQSLYRLLEKKGIKLQEGIETIEATAASDACAQQLAVEPGSPLLQAIRASWSISGQVAEYVIAYYKADLYQYTIRLKR